MHCETSLEMSKVLLIISDTLDPVSVQHCFVNSYRKSIFPSKCQSAYAKPRLRNSIGSTTTKETQFWPWAAVASNVSSPRNGNRYWTHVGRNVSIAGKRILVEKMSFVSSAGEVFLSLASIKVRHIEKFYKSILGIADGLWALTGSMGLFSKTGSLTTQFN